MIKIMIPDNHISERLYIADLLCRGFLGLQVDIELFSGRDYIVDLQNGNRIIVKDGFFSSHREAGLEYLHKDNLPSKITWLRHDLCPEGDLPVIYGSDELTITSGEIICGADIFASAFFMVSRWEEYVGSKKDKHGRFPAAESVAGMNNFLSRPIVNEYAGFFWNVLRQSGFSGERKKRKFELVLTHDIDETKKYNSLAVFCRTVLCDIVKRRGLGRAARNCEEYLSTRFQCRQDPYDTIGWLMDVSESINHRSHFYFMSGRHNKFDGAYDLEDQLYTLEEIRQRSHIVGFHPSYVTFDNSKLWVQEKARLEEVIGYRVVEGRQHYLRFAAPLTWQQWEDGGMQVDSSCGYAEQEGFRCGTGDEFPVYNFITRKTLNLLERPVIIMDQTLFGYRKYSFDAAEEAIKGLCEKAKKYNSKLTVLVHNSFVCTDNAKDFYLRVIIRQVT